MTNGELIEVLAIMYLYTAAQKGALILNTKHGQWQFPSPVPKLRGGKMSEIKRATDHGEGSVYIDGHLWGAPVAVLDKLDQLEARVEYLDIPYFLRSPGAVGEDVKREFERLKKRIAELESKISEFIYGEDNPDWISPDQTKIAELQARHEQSPKQTA